MSIPKPPSKARAGSIANLSIPQAPADNMTRPSEAKISFGFRVTPELHKRYKMISASTGVPMVDILEQSLELWAKEHMK
ncbi:ribbon-helix-helix domain-containing protein [Aureimonas sp. AU40]|uniref:ribbon-helix-helix domain-containing protein n=1 Tax=Aureimonas sp. AU40 TaxID=1637747 RepID=UPI0007835CBD|nr:ribbon-helix-helix domain-containing protein [Aureimonas sp. AU40]